jgi:hypothetical protein
MTDAAPGAPTAADVMQTIAGNKSIDPYIEDGATFVTKLSSTSGGLAALLAALTGAVAGILKVTQGKVDPPSAAIIDGLFAVAAIAILAAAWIVITDVSSRAALTTQVNTAKAAALAQVASTGAMSSTAVQVATNGPMARDGSLSAQFVPTGNLATISVADSDVMERVIAMRWDPVTGNVSYLAGREVGRPHWVQAADVGRSTFR